MIAIPQLRAFVTVWLFLLALLALTAGSSLIQLGPWNGIINLLVAVAKAALVAMFFMELRRDEPLPRVALTVAIGMLAVLFALSGSDFLVSRIAAAPWHNR